MERPIVYKKHCPLFMTTVSHFNPKEYRIPVDTEKLLSGCAGKRMEVSKRPVFMDIQNFKNTTKIVSKPLDAAATKSAKSVVKPLDVKLAPSSTSKDVGVRSAVGTPVGTPVASKTPVAALKPSTPSTVSTPSTNTPSGKTTPPPPGKTGLSTYQEEICHIKKSNSGFKCR